MKINLSNFKFKLVAILLAIMPFHYIICELVLKQSNIDNLWRDLLIITLVLIITFSKDGIILSSNNMSALICINICVIFIFAIISNTQQGVWNIARTYIMPMLIYFVMISIQFSQKQFHTLFKIIIITMIVIATYGFFQAFFLGDQFIIQLGYKSYNGFLTSTSYYIGGFFGKQRVVGTFESPNECGVILAIGMLTICYSNLFIKRNKKNIYIILISLGLIGTFSRSAIFGFILTILIWYIFMQRMKIKFYKIFKISFGIALCTILVYIFDIVFLNGLFNKMLVSSIGGLVNKTDASSIKHLQDLIGPVDIMLDHPFGFGFGNNGPMALAYSESVNTVESSIYLMMYELGIVGGILFFIPYISIIFKTLNNTKYKFYLPAMVSITVLFTYLLLPNVQSYEILFYSYLFFGLYDNPSIKKIFIAPEINCDT